MSWLLDGRGLEIIYKAQVRASLEYACLAWGGAAKKHLSLLDKVQARAVRIIENNNAGKEPHHITLQHRRDVAGLTVVFKVQVKRVSHLQALWQPYRLVPVTPRAVALAPAEYCPCCQPNTTSVVSRNRPCCEPNTACVVRRIPPPCSEPNTARVVSPIPTGL
ncbi:hypothetical protein GWK47_010038 [Chionoecetes opilio]|uniref:Uncharacterized protein n=1 Tax=Chionoecetes opilio TaxID=41210 RepID=A0A8J5CNA9_CHIOP|nr:hypothetical protein GWK47_010038 [Chionoecetes opilio]